MCVKALFFCYRADWLENIGIGAGGNTGNERPTLLQVFYLQRSKREKNEKTMSRGAVHTLPTPAWRYPPVVAVGGIPTETTAFSEEKEPRK